MPYEEEDTCMPYEEEDISLYISSIFYNAILFFDNNCKIKRTICVYLPCAPRALELVHELGEQGNRRATCSPVYIRYIIYTKYTGLRQGRDLAHELGEQGNRRATCSSDTKHGCSTFAPWCYLKK